MLPYGDALPPVDVLPSVVVFLVDVFPVARLRSAFHFKPLKLPCSKVCLPGITCDTMPSSRAWRSRRQRARRLGTMPALRLVMPWGAVISSAAL